MTPGRRPLSFDNFDQIMPDVERLLGGCTTLGNWTFPQICRHLGGTFRLSADLPASTPQDPSLWIGEELKSRLLASGMLPERYASPPGLVPTVALDEGSEAEGLLQAIAYYKASDGPVVPHLYLGPMSKAEWERFHLMHCAHHLSFAIPNARLRPIVRHRK